MSKNRLINYEFLRIICMSMVTSLHYWGHSGYLVGDFSVQYLLGWIIETVSLVATDVFIILSSYFLYDKNFSFKRIKKIYFKIFSVSIIGVIFAIVINICSISAALIKYFMPLLSREWGFVNNYLLFSCSTFLLNPFIQKCSKHIYEKILICLILVFCICPILSYGMGVDYIPINHGDNFVWFLVIYLFVGYVRKFNIRVSNTKALLIWLFPICIQYCTRVAIAIITRHFIGHVLYSGLFYQGDSTIFTFISAMGLFLLVRGFEDIQISRGVSRIVTCISGSSFVVYLVQEHPLVRDWIWKSVFNNMGNTLPDIIVGWLLSIICIYIIAVVINCFLDFFMVHNPLRMRK